MVGARIGSSDHGLVEHGVEAHEVDEDDDQAEEPPETRQETSRHGLEERRQREKKTLIPRQNTFFLMQHLKQELLSEESVGF